MHMHINEGGNLNLTKINPKSGRYCLNANLRKAARVIGTLYADAMHDSTLQGTQYTMLSTISAFNETTIGQLSEFMLMDQTTVTRAIKLLEKAGYVSVKQGKDRRQKLVSLTKVGQEILETSYPLWLEAQSKVWNNLGDEKAQKLLELTQQIVDLLEER